eukprot:Em0681g3a
MEDKWSSKWSIDKLTEENWSTWKFQTSTVLKAKKLWAFVDGDSATLPADASADQRARNGLTSKMLLMREFGTFRLNQGHSVNDHLKRFKEICDKLSAIEQGVTEEQKVMILLLSLPKSWDGLQTALMARGDDLTLSFVQQALLSEELKRQHLGEGDCDDDLAFHGTFRGECFNCGAEIEISDKDSLKFCVGVFGCMAFAHVPDDKRQKFDKKAWKLRFVGYADNQKGYRLWDSEKRRCIVLKDVIFNENEFDKVSSFDLHEFEEKIDKTEKVQEDVNPGSEKKEMDQSEQEEQPVTIPPPSAPLRKKTRSTAGIPPIRFTDEFGDFSNVAHNLLSL